MHDTLLKEWTIAQRFSIEQLAGRGGMGSIYRAHDLHGGVPVAVKLLHRANSPHELERFRREAQLLAELSHPSIVAYVDHGVTADGHPYLVMEWLEGEDLAQRLERQHLSLAETLLLVRRVAEALAMAHRRGIVHRDLKPSNIFLRKREVASAVLLDFGIARRGGASGALTNTGLVVGTPEYMSPEQARGQRELGAASDLFSLGCVLYECLIGAPPFAGDSVAAVLAKTLFEETPPLRNLRPDLPPAVESLVFRLLAKDPALRPPDASALLGELVALAELPDIAPPESGASLLPKGLRAAEQRLVCVVFAMPQVNAALQATLDAPAALQCEENLSELRALLTSFGAQAEVLANGSLVATLCSSHKTATDQAAQAARCALLIRSRWPQAHIAVATGRSALTASLPVGEALERAAALMKDSGAGRDDTSEPILVDEVTAGLLGPRFQVLPLPSGAFAISREVLDMDDSRPLLGRPTPCVGRDQELGAIEGALVSCVEDAAARAVLVTAPSGAGKSRLRHEFLRRLSLRGTPCSVLVGRGDPMSAGASYGLLGQALRRLCGIADDEPPEAKQQKLRQRIGPHRGPLAQDAQRIVEFIGELCGIPFPDSGSSRLRVARQDPRLMAEHVGGAFKDFLRSECAERPVILVLEDLHWGDSLTVRLVDGALRALGDQPLLIVAFARPEVHELFPNIWGRFVQHLPLHPLSKRACQKLARMVLGTEISESAIERLIDRAAGNALYLEELIRAAAQGKGDVPGTVMAMLQVRIGQLEPGPRQAVRAGSLFGESLWPAGIQAVLALPREEVEEYLDALVQEEILDLRRESRFAGEPEYRFRHALVRDAAYSLFSDADRTIGHRLALRFLLSVGEQDPLLLAEHAERASDHERAAQLYADATRQAYDACDLEETSRRAQRAVQNGAVGSLLGTVRSFEAMAAFWRRDSALALQAASASAALVPPGSPAWCRVMLPLLYQTLVDPGHERDSTLLAKFLLAEPDPTASSVYIESAALICSLLLQQGEIQMGGQYLQRIQQIQQIHPCVADDPRSEGSVLCAQHDYERSCAANPWRQRAQAAASADAFTRSGDVLTASILQDYIGQALGELGDPMNGQSVIRDVLARMTSSGAHFQVLHARLHLAALLASYAADSEALQITEDILGTPTVSVGLKGWAHGIRAQVFLQDGALLTAAEHAQNAVSCSASAPFRRAWAESLLLLAWTHQGLAEEAIELSVKLQSEMTRLGCGGYVEREVNLAVAECLYTFDQHIRADAVLQHIVTHLHATAAEIPDDGYRDSFLRQVPVNRRILTLAAERFGATT